MTARRSRAAFHVGRGVVIKLLVYFLAIEIVGALLYTWILGHGACPIPAEGRPNPRTQAVRGADWPPHCGHPRFAPLLIVLGATGGLLMATVLAAWINSRWIRHRVAADAARI